MVKGLDTFASFFAGDEAHYVLIGGVATQLVLEAAGLPARATKDLDIVLRVEALDAVFGAKLWAFIRDGRYERHEQGVVPRRFYRFRKPANPTFPEMLEFFATEPGRLPLAEGAHLTPVPIDAEIVSLSAILMDRHYYDFLHAHTRTIDGVRVATENALIPLKARAWLDQIARRASDPQSVDARHLTKHRNDVLRLSQLLSDAQRTLAPASVAADMAAFTEAAAAEINEPLLRSLDILEPAAALMARLRAVYAISLEPPGF